MEHRQVHYTKQFIHIMVEKGDNYGII